MANINEGNNVDLHGNQLLHALIEVLAADPGAPEEGRFWYNSTSHLFKFRNNGTTFVLGRLSDLLAPNASVDFNNHKATGLADGVAATDGATVGQLSAASLGMDLREDARVAVSAGNVVIAAPGANLDGVAMANGNRVLLTAQTVPTENGLYDYNGAANPMTRSADFDSAADMDQGILIPVDEGTKIGLWLHTTSGAIVVGTTALTFTFIGPAAAVGYAAFAADFGDGAATSFNVDHNLNTKDVTVQVYRNADGEDWDMGVVRSTVNRVVITTGSYVPSAAEFRAVVKK
jgi:hypothetical protein